jgi:hypothetical protein
MGEVSRKKKATRAGVISHARPNGKTESMSNDKHMHISTSPDIETIQRIERKFFILPRNLDFARTIMNEVCRPDSQFPEGQVNSLYYDTIDLAQYMRSVDGDLRKHKLRIRWYDKIEDYEGDVPIFVELKMREGLDSTKQRKRVLVPPRYLDRESLSNGIIDNMTMARILAAFGYFPDRPLRPVVLISYHRHRFTEVMTGARVSLDYDIRSTLVVRELGYGERDLKLRGGVLEIKRLGMDLPPILVRRVNLLNTEWSRYSKYGQCIETHLSHPSAIARLWPSGKVVEV